MINLPDPNKLVVTRGVLDLLEKEGLGYLQLDRKIYETYKEQPDECLDGGNDKRFFSFYFISTKLFAAENEVGGLTVMLPEEY